jgi:SPP1 family predicted phage head-tail adaptor
MKAGKLYHRLAIQEDKGTAVNALNERVENWATLTTRYGSIEPLTGRELWTAQQVQADVTHKIRMRSYAGLKPKMRLVFQGRIFNIGSVRNLEEVNEELEIFCKEQV